MTECAFCQGAGEVADAATVRNGWPSTDPRHGTVRCNECGGSGVGSTWPDETAEAALYALRASGVTPMGETVLCGYHLADEALREYALLAAAGSEDWDGVAEFRPVAGFPDAACVECAPRTETGSQLAATA